jgi:luciferase family oxidoreductase group 1
MPAPGTSKGEKMDFGTFHLFETIDSTETAAVHDQIDLMIAAEDLGFSSVWAAEHHFSEYGVCPSPILALAAVARQTKTLRLGTGIVVLPFHDPLRVAEELAFVDHLSNGRLEVGVGRGYRPRELEGFGVDPLESRAITNEALEIIRQAWTEKIVEHDGEHFKVRGVSVYPRPFRDPHPPVYLGSLSAETFPLVGKLGVNLLFTPTFREGEDIPAQIAEYKQAVIDAGGDPSTKRIGALRMVYVAETTDQAEAEFEPAWRRFHEVAQAQNAPREGEISTPDTAKYRRPVAANLDEAQQAGNVIAGDPDHVLEQLRQMQDEWQLTDLILWTRVGGLSKDKVLSSMRLFSEHVMPHLQTSAASAA